MAHRHEGLARHQSDYLFVEVAKRKEKLLATHPGAKILSLGIGDTTEPIPNPVVEAFVAKARALGVAEEYTGYGAPFGDLPLRNAIAKNVYASHVDEEEVFISDGAKCDLGRLQLLFGPSNAVAIQDPAYPAYVDASVMAGKKIKHLPCTPGNHFFPEVKDLPPADLLYICSPNNPTGAVLSRRQLKELVAFAQENRSIIIFDSAYAAFIRDPALPRSIFEIEGARDVAIEVGSFSKLAGFTGVRLGWSVIPSTLRYHDGSSVQEDWKKIASTFFNGPSNLAQAGGLAALTNQGLAASEELCCYYLENARILKEAVECKGYRCYGGDNAPYLWIDIQGRNSWDFFDHILKEAHVVTTPGVGFGPSGEGFLRLSAFDHRDQIIEAAQRLQNALPSPT